MRHAPKQPSHEKAIKPDIIPCSETDDTEAYKAFLRTLHLNKLLPTPYPRQKQKPFSTKSFEQFENNWKPYDRVMYNLLKRSENVNNKSEASKNLFVHTEQPEKFDNVENTMKHDKNNELSKKISQNDENSDHLFEKFYGYQSQNSQIDEKKIETPRAPVVLKEKFQETSQQPESLNLVKSIEPASSSAKSLNEVPTSTFDNFEKIEKSNEYKIDDGFKNSESDDGKNCHSRYYMSALYSNLFSFQKFSNLY